jgi:FkbH-like protein
VTRSTSIRFAGDVLTLPLGRLDKLLPEFALEIRHQDIDQVHQLLAGPADADVVVLHVSSDFFLEEATAGEPLKRMAAYCAAVRDFAARESSLILVNTLEWQPSRIVGEKYLDDLIELSALNAQIIDLARGAANVSVIDAAGIVAAIGARRALSMQNRLAMRMPYTKTAIEAITMAYAQAIRERYAARKKVIVVDADNTLWSGIVGEDGIEGIAVDRQYPGLVYRRFQSQLLEMREAGLLLALVTKNNRADIEEVFRRREMPLVLDHFSAIRINWEAKSENIRGVAVDLNLGLESLIFIDDNPFELEQVAAALPMVDSYRFDASRVDEALGLLASIEGLKTWSVTAEDKVKAAQYAQERMRSVARADATSLPDYLASLNIRLEIGCNRSAQVKRISQLTNKTNQFNLTTRRHSEAEIGRLMETGTVFDVRLVDRFGDMGVIGVVIVDGAEIETFLMSCRALGRGIEGAILAHVCERIGRADLMATYRPTGRNLMTAEFYEANGFALIGTGEDGVKFYRLAEGPILASNIHVSEVE